MSDSLDAIDTLKQQILEHRSSGEIYVEIHQNDGSKIELDQFVVRLDRGFKPLGSSWREIDQSEAHQIILLILSQDLAYNSEIMEVEFAESLTSRFLNLFSDSARYFTNGNFRTYYLDHMGDTFQPLKKTTPHAFGGWMPLTEATFDTGVVCFDENYIALIWVEDED